MTGETKRTTLGQALQSRRKELHHSQTEAAALIATTQGNLSRWERNLSSPQTREALTALAEYLDCSSATLIGLVVQAAIVRTQRELEYLLDDLLTEDVKDLG
jgi:transcriptional regulator with XRE-family HTH domain